MFVMWLKLVFCIACLIPVHGWSMDHDSDEEMQAVGDQGRAASTSSAAPAIVHIAGLSVGNAAKFLYDRQKLSTTGLSNCQCPVPACVSLIVVGALAGVAAVLGGAYAGIGCQPGGRDPELCTPGVDLLAAGLAAD